MLAMAELVNMLAAVDRLKHKGLLTEQEYRDHVDPYVHEHGMDSRGLANHIAKLVLAKAEPANDHQPDPDVVAA
jgi:hypothetical protein